MADKRLPATPRKRREMAKKGMVPRSAELAAALVFIAGFTAVALTISGALSEVRRLMALAVSPQANVFNILQYAVIAFVKVIVPPVLAAFLACCAAHIFAGERTFSLRFSLEKLNVVAGIGRMFSRRAIFEILKGIVKVVAVGIVAGLALQKLVPSIIYSPGAVQEVVYAYLARIGLVAAAIAIADFVYQRWEYEKSIAMTTEEAKEETKETEGNPEVKRKLKQWMRKITVARASVKNVKNASVILTNPTKYAVGLRYEQGKTPAPVVVAKGTGRLAEKIRTEAARLGVPVVQNPPLARALYRLDIGKSIPPELYRAVAEVLAQIWRAAKERGLRV